MSATAQTSCPPFDSGSSRTMFHVMRNLYLLALMVSSSIAHAQQPASSVPASVQSTDTKIELSACLSRDHKAATLSNHVIGCYERELKRWDVKLNTFYGNIARKYPDLRPRLLDGQRAWIAYRDAWCGYEGLIEQPPSAATSKAICLSDLTEMQAKRISELYDAPAEEDVSDEPKPNARPSVRKPAPPSVR